MCSLIGHLFTCRCRLFRTQRKCPFIDNRFSAVLHKNADADNGNYSPKPLNCDRQILPSTVGFQNDEIGCPYFQVFETNLPFGPLDGDTWWCIKWRKNHYANAYHAIVSWYAGVIDNSHGNY